MAAIRVLVTDDSLMFRKVLSEIINNEPGLELVGTARDGEECVEMTVALRPDVITLDIEMPRLNGLDAIPKIREKAPNVPIVMFSSLTEVGATGTLEALSRGASDYVAKPSSIAGTKDGMTAIREELIPKIKALAARGTIGTPRQPLPSPGSMLRAARAPAATQPAATPAAAAPTAPAPMDKSLPAMTTRAPAVPAAPALRRSHTRPQILAIGSSTGGPNALADVLTKLPATFPLPIVITQHMPAVFTRLLSERLDSTCKLTVREGQDGMEVEQGVVLIAPGDFHMTLARSGARIIVKLDQNPKENYCRPAVDPMFRSAAAVYGGKVLAAVLTGMGHDGMQGAQVIHAAGGVVIAQDKPSSVVWGMPGAVVDANLADEVLPIQQIADALQRRAAGSTASSPRAKA